MGAPSKPGQVPITVSVSDLNRMGCQLLRAVLVRSHHNLQVVACSSDSAGTIDAVKQHQPDIALVSAALQDGTLSGFRVLREIRRACPQTRVVMLLDSSERDLVIDAFRGGACGVFSRSEMVERLSKCIHSVHRGQIWASSRDLQFLLEALAKAAPLRVVDVRGTSLLTRREEQIVRLVVEGLTNREVSQKLSLSEHTVKNYLFRVYDKLGISSRVELTLYTFSQVPHVPLPVGQ